MQAKFDQAEALLKALKADVQDAEGDLVQLMRRVIERERKAAYLEGIIYGVQHGLKGLADHVELIEEDLSTRKRVVAQRVPESQLQSLPLTNVDDGESQTVQEERADKKPRNPPGFNEMAVYEALTTFSSGARIHEIRRHMQTQVGIWLAESSTRKALDDLLKKKKALEDNGVWFVNRQGGSEDTAPGSLDVYS